MAKFSATSAERLATCDARLLGVFKAVVVTYDCTILEGHRSRERQAELYEAGRSQVQVSAHNRLPSAAVDVAPYPIPEEWGAVETLLATHGAHGAAKILAQFYHFAGYVLGVARERRVSLRWGGDWDGDRRFDDQTFDDLVHFELRD